MTEFEVIPKVEVRLDSFVTNVAEHNIRADGPEPWVESDVEDRIAEMSDEELADRVRAGIIDASAYRQ